MEFAVLTSELERLGRKVGREHARAGKLERQRERQATRPGSQIENLRLRDIGQELARAVDEQLGFGSRNQNARTDAEIAAIELSLSDQVGTRLALGAAHEQLPGGIELR